MKLFKVLLASAALGVLLTWPAFPDGSVSKVKRSVRAGAYDSKHKCRWVCRAPKPFLECRWVCRAPKPFLEVVEDGLAYALDIPLAILSPITCPIVRPLMDAMDDEDRTYYRRKR
jgi:hypothetical protein